MSTDSERVHGDIYLFSEISKSRQVKNKIMLVKSDDLCGS